MTISSYNPDTNVDYIDSRLNEAVASIFESRILALFEEQAAAEFHTQLPSANPVEPEGRPIQNNNPTLRKAIDIS